MTKSVFVRHAASAALPDLSPDDYGALVDSMRENGFDKSKPIIVCDGEIIVGWHRYEAAYEADVLPTFDARKTLELTEVYRIVYADELARRHMSPAERADALIGLKRACGIEFAETGGDRQSIGSGDPMVEISTPTVAEEAKVSPATAKRAIARRKEAEGIKPPTPAAPPPTSDPEKPKPKPRKRQSRKKTKPQDLPPSIPGEDDPDLTAMFESALKDIDALRADKEILEEQVKDLTIAADPKSLAVSTKLGNQDEMIRTLNASVNEWMYRHGEARKEANACLRARKKLDRKVKDLEARIKELEGVEA